LIWIKTENILKKRINRMGTPFKNIEIVYLKGY